jgi:zinc and cadmium transporter
MPLTYAALSILIVSSISLIGVTVLSVREHLIRKYVFLFVSLAIGALLGDAFLHLIPEAVEELGSLTSAGAAIIAGIILFFIIEKLLHWHHHGLDADAHVAPVGKLMLISDGFHNFIDGIIIGLSYLVSTEVGIATTIAVLLHEIPQEIGDFGVLVHAGYSKTRALFWNFISALTAFLGLGAVMLLGTITETLTVWMLPIAAGGFLYIAVADLIPELYKHNSKGNILLQGLIVALGVLIMAALLLLE